MKLNIDGPPDDVQIQVVPLLDVVFCILTFFILASLQLTRQQGINLDLPKASTGQVQMREMLVVTIDSAGQTYVDKQLVDRLQLFQAIKAYHDQKPDGLLVLNAAQTAFYNDVVQVLDMLRSVGGDRVALATTPQAPGVNPASPNPLFPGSNPAFPGVNPVPPGVSPPSGLPPGGLSPSPNFDPNGLNPSPGLSPGFGAPVSPSPGQLAPSPAPSFPGTGTAPQPNLEPSQ